MKKVPRLEDSELWRSMYSLANIAFDSLAELPSEEDFQLKFSIKSSAYAISRYTASAVGSISPAEKIQHFSMVRSSLFTLKESIKTAHSRYDQYAVNPDTMLEIDRLVEAIDTELLGLDSDLSAWNEKIYPSIIKKDLESTSK